MSRITLVLCAWTTLTAPAAIGSQEPERLSPRPESARVEVLRGRAVVMERTRRSTRTLGANEHLLTSGTTHLEVGAGSQVRVQWAGRASMRIWGPSSIQWESAPAPDKGREGGSAAAAGSGDLASFSSGSLVWRIFDLAWIDCEVRRGRHVLHLPGNWRAEFERGSVHLRGLPSGPVEVRHHAGRPLTLTWLGDERRARPPVTIYPGSIVRLDRPAPSRPDDTRDARAWSDPSWPWREAQDTPEQVRQRLELARETQVFEGSPTSAGQPPRGPVAGISEFEAPEGVRVRIEAPAPLLPSPQPPHGQNPAPRAPQRERTTVPERSPRPLGSPARSPGPPAQDGPPGYSPTDWRGLAWKDLEGWGPLAIERSEDVQLRLFATGRRRVSLDVMAPRALWCFTPRRDYLMQPGAVLVFESDGSLRMRFGRAEERPALPGRPSFDRLGR